MNKWRNLFGKLHVADLEYLIPGESVEQHGVKVINNSPDKIGFVVGYDEKEPEPVPVWQWAYKYGDTATVHITTDHYATAAEVVEGWKKNRLFDIEQRVIIGPVYESETLRKGE